MGIYRRILGADHRPEPLLFLPRPEGTRRRALIPSKYSALKVKYVANIYDVQ